MSPLWKSGTCLTHIIFRWERAQEEKRLRDKTELDKTAREGRSTPPPFLYRIGPAFGIPFHFHFAMHPLVTKGKAPFNVIYVGLGISGSALTPSLLRPLFLAVSDD